MTYVTQYITIMYFIQYKWTLDSIGRWLYFNGRGPIDFPIDVH